MIHNVYRMRNLPLTSAEFRTYEWRGAHPDAEDEVTGDDEGLDEVEE
jgi:hypothetical protein